MAWIKKAQEPVPEPPLTPPEWPAFGMLMDFVYYAGQFISVEQFWTAVESGVTGQEPEEVLEKAKKDDSTPPFNWSWDDIANFVEDQVNDGWEPMQIVDMVRDYYPQIPQPK